MTGDTYADIVVWRWERSRMRWVSKLSDGTELVVALQHLGRRSFWNPSMDGMALPDNGFRDPESAEKAALAAWRKRTEKDAATGRAGDITVADLQRAGIVSSEPAAARTKPTGSSPALRIGCPVDYCKANPGLYCIKRDGSAQTIAHKKRRELEERTR